MQIGGFSESVTAMLAQQGTLVVWACELDFKDGPVYAHTGTGELILDGKTYLGVGQFGDISSANESMDGSSPHTVDLTLNGLDSSILSETNVNGCRGRFGRVLFVAIDADGNYATDILFSGRMDAAKFRYSGNDGDNAITVTIVDRMAEWNRKGTERWTDESVKARHDGDRICYAVAEMAQKPIYWGNSKDGPRFTYSR